MKVWRTALVFVLGTALGFGAAKLRAFYATPQQGRALSPDQLLEHPLVYRDRTVRVRGQFTDCWTLGCKLCPETLGVTGQGGARRCLGLEFATTPRNNNQEMDLLDRLYRFATVTLTARFNPDCLHGCTDRATVLFDARDIEVHSRKSASTGLVAEVVGFLVAPPASERASMLRAIRTAATDYWNRSPAEVWLVASQPSAGVPQNSGDGAKGFGCICLQASCTGVWPDKIGPGFASPGNPYICSNLMKTGEVWRADQPQ